MATQVIAEEYEAEATAPVVKVDKGKMGNALVREASCHSSMLIAGWSDASNGPLIPYIQTFYGISYTVVSMLFVGQMVGFLSASFVNSYFTEHRKGGLGRVIALGGVVQALGYIFLIPAFPFPIMPVCYAVIGFGMALQDAQANTYIATLPNADYKFGLLHASYGLGALVCPLAATAFASSGIRFTFFYAISLGLSIVNVGVLLNAFRFSYRIEVIEPAPKDPGSGDEMELQDMASATQGEKDEVSSTTVPRARSTEASKTKTQKNSLHTALTSRTVWVCAVFILFYVGSEVSMGGWIVTFLQESRDGGVGAGYVATGFWGGLTLGRAISAPFNRLVGEQRVIFLYLFLAICLEIAIWFARDFIGNAVTVALVGFLIGPIYPITMSVCTKLLPRSIHAASIGFIAAFGQTGSALFPFITGALAQRFNPGVLQPVMIVLFAVQAALWLLCPSVEQKSD